jgi:hypothetical protein
MSGDFLTDSCAGMSGNLRRNTGRTRSDPGATAGAVLQSASKPASACVCSRRTASSLIWAVTSRVSGNGDQGADPNKLVMITDNLAATSLPASESFATVETARFAEVLRGVSFTPGTGARCDQDRGRDDDCRDDDR